MKPAGDDGGWSQWFEVTTGAEVAQPTSLALRRPRARGGRGLPAAGLLDQRHAHRAGRVRRLRHHRAGLRLRRLRRTSTCAAASCSCSRTSRGRWTRPAASTASVNTPFAELRTKAINAREHGALGLLVVNGPRFHAGEPVRAPRADGQGYMTSGLAAGWVSDSLGAELLRGAGTTLLAAQAAIDSAGRPRSFALRRLGDDDRDAHAHPRAHPQRGRPAARPRHERACWCVGAHFDHLGYGGERSLSPDQRVAHPGADDNASGSAALLGAARLLSRTRAAGLAAGARRDLRRLHRRGDGHRRLVALRGPPAAAARARRGHAQHGHGRPAAGRQAHGHGHGHGRRVPRPGREREPRGGGFDLKTTGDGYGPSDHSSFYKKQVPVLMLFTGAHADYHGPTRHLGQDRRAGPVAGHALRRRAGRVARRAPARRLREGEGRQRDGAHRRRQRLRRLPRHHPGLLADRGRRAASPACGRGARRRRRGWSRATSS